MILLLDIGNTHTHLGLANGARFVKKADMPTPNWFGDAAGLALWRFVGQRRLDGVALCSVVPLVTPRVRTLVREHWGLNCLALTHVTARGLRLDYPHPQTIGADRLANAIAVVHHYGAPAIVVNFGTAVTFDVVDRRGAYVGGIITPGLALMTRYLHEKTALLPRIAIREIDSVIGKSTVEAMRIGAVHGFRGLIRELLMELRRELRVRRLPVVATGGYAALIAARLPDITAVDKTLTLEGLRLLWERHRCPSP